MVTESTLSCLILHPPTHPHARTLTRTHTRTPTHRRNGDRVIIVFFDLPVALRLFDDLEIQQYTRLEEMVVY